MNELKALLEAEIKAQLAKESFARKIFRKDQEARKNEREKDAEEINELKKEATERKNQYKQIQAILKSLLESQASSTNAALQLLDSYNGDENVGTENNGAGNI